MPTARDSITVDPGGLSMLVDITDSYGTSTATYTSASGTTARTLPMVISSATAFYLPNPGEYAVSAKFNGLEVAGPAGATATVSARHGAPVTVTANLGPVELGTALGSAAAGYLKSADIPTAAIIESHNRLATPFTDVSAALVSGTLCMWGIPVPAGTTVSHITLVSGNTAESGGSHLWAGFFSAALVQQAISADTTGAAAWAANTAFTFDMATPYVTTTSGLHYIGVCCVGTVPTLMGCVDGRTNVANLPPIVAGNADASLTDPASCPTTATALTVSLKKPYFYLS